MSRPQAKAFNKNIPSTLAHCMDPPLSQHMAQDRKAIQFETGKPFRHLFKQCYMHILSTSCEQGQGGRKGRNVKDEKRQ